MALLLQISGVSHEQDDVVGEYDDNAQMWSTYANLSSVRDLPADLLIGATSTSAGGKDSDNPT